MEMMWSLNKKELLGVVGYTSLLPLAIYTHSLKLFSSSIAIVGLVITLPLSPIALLVSQAPSGTQQLLLRNVIGCWLAMFAMAWFSLVQIKGLAARKKESISRVLLGVVRRSVILIILIITVAPWHFLP